MKNLTSTFLVILITSTTVFAQSSTAPGNTLANDTPKTASSVDCSDSASSEPVLKMAGDFNVNDLPKSMRDFANENNFSQKGKIFGSVGLRNDFILPGAGWVAFVFNPKAGDLYAKDFDMAFTHESTIDLSSTMQNGLRFNFEGQTRLYTQATGAAPINKVIPIFFTEENRLLLSLNNREAGNPVDYSGTIGNITLNSQKIITPLAASQQEFYHDYINRTPLQPHYSYIPDGSGIQNFSFLNATIAITKTLAQGGSCRLDVRNQVSGTAATAGALDLASARTEIIGKKYFRRSKLEATVFGEATLHSKGLQLEPAFILTYTRKAWGIRSSLEYPGNQLVNYEKYNYSYRPITGLAVFFRIRQ